MIIVYPMLVSRAVSENSIPGIAKTVENFIIINRQADIINNVNATKKRSTIGRLFSIGGRLMMKEDEDLSEAGIPPGTGGSTGSKADRIKQMDDLAKKEKEAAEKYKEADEKIKKADEKMNKAQDAEEKKKAAKEKVDLEREKQDYKRERDIADDELKTIERERKFEKEDQEKLEKNARKASAKVDVSDMKSITLEPTYMTVEHSDKHGNKSSSFIGVKVVPIRVKSDVKLSHLLLYDTQVNSLFAITLKYGRVFTRKFWAFFDRWTSRFRIGGLTPSGDPRRDIIMRRTGMGKESETFIVLSKQEDVDEFFLDNIQKINRLFNMGWGNFVIADDIGRTAWFCMERFNGMCNSVPYAMMYKHLGQEKAYETMEDARKANSSIFKIKKSFSRVVGECKAELKLDKYSMLSEDNHDE